MVLEVLVPIVVISGVVPVVQKMGRTLVALCLMCSPFDFGSPPFLSFNYLLCGPLWIHCQAGLASELGFSTLLGTGIFAYVIPLNGWQSIIAHLFGRVPGISWREGGGEKDQCLSCYCYWLLIQNHSRVHLHTWHCWCVLLWHIWSQG